ncbi:MAG TPA: hypothetical protein DCL44_03840, partial [Elusimicrobia bacterium]|nr:hypothetical protein [Elusimicrobiota bacterium]
AGFLRAGFIFVLVFGCRSVWGGISTPYGEIVLDNVPVGEKLNMRELTSVAYRARNTSDFPVRMVFMVVGRDEGEQVKKGYEKIPDLAWISLAENEFQLAPGQEAVSDVYISIPNKPEHLGKKYQVYIWACGYPAGDEKNLQLVAGVKSRILLNIAPTPLTQAQRRKVDDLKASLSFQLIPDKILLKEIPLGKKVEVKGVFKKSFKVINPNDQELRLKNEVVERIHTNLSLPGGWEDPPAQNHYLDITPKEILVPANSIEEIQLTLQFPENKELKGKKYLFTIATTLQDFDVPVTFNGRVFAEIQ